MAAFASFAAAETRAKAKSSGFGDNTWVEAYPGKTQTGAWCVMALRKMPPITGGGWAEITDDAAV